MYGRKIGKYSFETSAEVFKDVMGNLDELTARINCVARIYASWHHFGNERVTMQVDQNDETLVHCEFYEAKRKIHTDMDTGAEGSHAGLRANRS